MSKKSSAYLSCSALSRVRQCPVSVYMVIYFNSQYCDQAKDWPTRVNMRQGQKFFLCPHCPDWLFRASAVPFTRHGGVSLGLKWPRRECDHLIRSVSRPRPHSHTILRTCMARRLVAHTNATDCRFPNGARSKQYNIHGFKCFAKVC